MPTRNDYYDLIRTTSVTLGTGNLTMSATAPDSYRTPQSVYSEYDRFTYSIRIPGGADYETGEGYRVGNALVRERVRSSSNANAAVDWPAGTKDIIVGLLADEISRLTRTRGVVIALVSNMHLS